MSWQTLRLIHSRLRLEKSNWFSDWRRKTGKNIFLFKRLATAVAICFYVVIVIISRPSTLHAGVPDGYYDNAEGKSGSTLRTALYDIIKGHTEYPYTSTSADVWDALKDIDEDTSNSANVILLYTGRSQAKIMNSGDTTSSDNNLWNREHVWAKSHGDFGTNMGPGTDLHHLRPADESVNSTRNNLDFDNGGDAIAEAPGCYYDSDSFEPRDAVKGDIARMLFYMDARYEGEGDEPDLQLMDSVFTWGTADPDRPYHGKLSTLIQWHEADPVDNLERIRNDKIYTDWQHNRNPFIDHPEYVSLIWGTDSSSSADTTESDGPTALTAGDIVIIGINCDDPDDFAFVPLVDLGAGTTINFTDNGWLSTNSFRSGEGILTYTSTSVISSGTVIGYTESSGNFSSSGSFSLSASGDQIIAYQGTASSPTMIYGVNVEGSAVWQADATSSNTSALPLGLTNGMNCVAVIEYDNVNYIGSVTAGKTAVLAAVSNKDNWVGNDAVRYDFTTISDYSLPVTLTSFTADVNGGRVALAWRTESETENLGFIIQRKTLRAIHDSPSVWSQMASYATDDALAGHGSTSEAHEYAYTDATVGPGAMYLYRLGDVDYGGSVTWHKEIEVEVKAEDEQTPTVFGLQAAYPNPFNPSVTIPYSLAKDGRMSLKVYNLRGELVKELISTYCLKGSYSMKWSPQNLSAGIYVIRMQAGHYTSIQKVVFVK